MRLKHLDLFSGIGGFGLPSQWVGGIQTTQFVEINAWCRRLLKQNFPGIPTHDDIATFTSHRGDFDLFTAGFPCQDLSVAGNQKGIQEGTRSGLFFEIVRLIRECGPRYVLLENVPALLSSNGGRDMGTVLWELSEVGYDAEWQIVSANALGANHTRERLWIVAYPHSVGYAISEWEKREAVQQWGLVPANDEGEKLRPRYQRNELSRSPRSSAIAQSPRRNDGLPRGVDVAERLKALGNSIVPQCAEIPLRRILEIERQLNQAGL
jgi:DNA (cytosine-5)-methyltransferase 1